MMAYLRARSSERCTAIGAGMLVVMIVLYVAQRFPPAEHALVHYADLAIGTAVSAALMAFRDRTLAWLRDLVLFSRSTAAQPTQKDTAPMASLTDTIIAAIEAYPTSSELGREEQALVGAIIAAYKAQSLLALVPVVEDALVVLATLRVQPAGAPAVQGAPETPAT